MLAACFPEKSISRWKEQIAVVSEKIHTCLGTELLRNVITQLPLDLDLDNLEVDPQTLKVTDILLNSICHIVVTASHHDNSQCQGHPEKVQWLSQLLIMLIDHRPVLTTVGHRLCDLITRQGPALQTYHVKGLAVIVVHMATIPQLRNFLNVKSSSSTSPRLKTSIVCGSPLECATAGHCPRQSSTQSDPQTQEDTRAHPLVEWLFVSIPCCNAAWMEFILRLTTGCLEYACRAFNSVTLDGREEGQAIVPATLVKLFVFVVQRLCQTVRLPCSRDPDKTHQLAAAVYQSEVFQMLLKDSPLSLQEWMAREIEISTCDDCLSATDRQDYFDWVIQQQLVEMTRSCDMSVRRCATVLLNVILDFDGNGCSPSLDLTHEISRCGNSRSDMLLLLQRLMTHVSCEDKSSVGDKQPWLVAVLHERLASLSEDRHSAAHNEALNFFRLIRCLPAHLLFTLLPPGGVLPRGHLEAVLDLVNSHFRNHLSDDTGCSLDLSATLYLLQGLIALAAYSLYDVDRFIKDCPLLVVSVVWHWPNLVSHMPKCAPEGSAIQRLLVRVKKIIEFTTSEMSGTIDTPFDDEDSWIVGVALCAEHNRQCRGETTQQERLILTISAQKTLLKQHQADDILRSFQECALSFLTRELLLENSLTSHQTSLLLQLWLDMPLLLHSLPHGHQMAVFKLVLPDSIQSLRPVTCMRVLVKPTTDQLVKMTTQDDHIISVLLQVYNECCRLHDQTSHPHVLASDTRVISLKFMLDAAAVVRKLLSRQQPSRLQRLDRSLLESCDPEVKNMIKHFATR
ncbi:hypothetical protein LSAT2_026229 [Lamellibrachia satsuma]|nr:hypothetical protein LSAT2_026229 [Lamellibrachia satsuma]